MSSSWLLAAVSLVLPCPAVCQIAILQIRVVDGEGAVHAAGTRSARPLTVEVTDETGRPIERAAVSFHLPEEGPGGVFLNGLRTDVALTDAAGRAAVRGLQWNRIPGRFQLRIFAAYEQARAGTVSFQYIEGPSAPAASPSTAGWLAIKPAGRSHSKWLLIGALAACGTIAAGIVAAHSGGSAASPAVPPPPPLTIGTPTITIGKP